jgi:chromosome segregation protein
LSNSSLFFLFFITDLRYSLRRESYSIAGGILKLKDIEIIGFKSFADKIKLEFDQGVTAIVGPNGCGKSNISDAFRWVLGEQSAKSMRGGKMADVIFAGTSTRKPLNFAEVTITLSEINGFLDIEYEEVAITRRLHRSGESEYLLNRQPIRWKDLQSLLWDSGIGKDDYAFFEQGEMDHIINSTPLERRYIFEQASGILRFLHRKKEALRKLELAEGNINRVKDIHHEVEKRVKVLREQAEKARVFKENKTKAEDLEKGVFLAKWDNLHTKKIDLHKKQSDRDHAKQQAVNNYETCRQDSINAKQSLLVQEKQLQVKREDVFKARSQRELRIHEKQTTLERLKEGTAKEKQWLLDLEGLFQKRKQRQAEQETKQKQHKVLEAELASQEGSLKELRETTLQVELEVNRLREQQQQIQKAHLKFLQTENQIESELKQTHVRLESYQDKLKAIHVKIEKISAQQVHTSRQLKDQEQKFKDISSMLDDQKKQFTEKDKVLTELNQIIQKNQDQLAKLQKQKMECKAREKVLLRLKEEMEGFSECTKKLLKEASNPKSPVYQKLKSLYEFVVPQKGQEQAVSAIMKPYGQTLVVRTQEEFHAVMAFAQKQKLKDFSLISLDSTQQADLEDTSFPAAMFSDLKEPLMIHFFKRLGKAKNYEEALSLSRQHPGSLFWLEEGAYLDPHQVLLFTSPSESNVFMRQAELNELTATLQGLESSIQELGQLVQESQEQKSKVYVEKIELDKTIRKHEMTLLEVNFTLQKLKADRENLKNEELHLHKESEGVSEALSKLTSTLDELTQKNREAKSQGTEIASKSTSLNQWLEKELARLKQQQATLHEKEAHFHKATDENRKTSHFLHVLEVKDLESQQQETRLEHEIKLCREQQEHIQKQGHLHDKNIQEAEKLLLELTSAYSEMEKAAAQQKKILEALEQKSNEMQAQIKKIEQEGYQIGVQTAQVDTQIENLEKELQERYRATIPQLKSVGIKLDKSLDYAERQLRLLKNDMESAGDVNMMSIEEFEQHRERHMFLNRELDDMNASRQDLVKIIASLDDESRKQFKTTFDQIKINFKKNFAILFQGGEADLEFTDSSDVLEAGIDITAKPPGKQMRSIHLLSGGEKCLTAMALLFAIFEVKASPFCILDEIDAPLDDTNVERFINVLKQFIDRCQFIIITHNKKTMSAADILFGVSMEEKGVSKILSMEFERKPTVSKENATVLTGK